MLLTRLPLWRIRSFSTYSIAPNSRGCPSKPLDSPWQLGDAELDITGANTTFDVSAPPETLVAATRDQPPTSGDALTLPNKN
jgi:hypothetical protein